MRAGRPSRLAALVVSVSLISLGLATVPAGATVDPSVTPDAKTILEGDLTDYQWMLGAVNAPQAWTESTGAGTTIAILDTGVDASHPDLVGRVVPGGVVKVADDGTTSVVDATVDRTSNDWYGHGTHVAGIAAGDADGNGITGIAPDAQIMPVMLLTHRSSWLGPAEFLDSVSQGIDFAVAHGAGVLNLSLGAPSSHLSGDSSNDEYRAALARVCTSVADATAAGSVVVVSSGNAGDWIDYQSAPASCPGAVSVAAVGADLHRTYWSTFDPTVAIAAPGLDVLSGDSAAANLTPADHILESGTSMSAPVVTGVAALIEADDPGLTAEQVASAMTSTAQDLGPPGRDAETGFGLVDAAAALGVATPPASSGDFFTAAIDSAESLGGRAPSTPTEAVVRWTVPAADSVTGYTVRVFDDTGTTEHDVGGLEVRLQLVLAPEAWVQVVAHTTSGDVATFPVQWGQGGQWVPPAKVRNPTADRHRDLVHVRWREPKDTTGISAVVIAVSAPRSWRYVTRRIPWDGVSPFPTEGRIRLPERLRWSDLRVVVVSMSQVGDGSNEEWGRPARVPGLLPAFYGMHVDRVTGAGPRAFEVSGGISAVLAGAACGTAKCAGRKVTVRVDLGRRTSEVVTRLTGDGQFHALLGRPTGRERVRLRVIGPDNLTSGPYKRFPVRR
jgi:subtilisin family serine protease